MRIPKNSLLKNVISMKLVSFDKNKCRLGLLADGFVYDLNKYDGRIPGTMSAFLKGGERTMDLAREAQNRLTIAPEHPALVSDATLIAPVPKPTSLRDAYAFRQHVETSRLNRGLDMITAFDQFPVFYFSNHKAIFGGGDIYCEKDHFNKLDFELEVAIVLNRGGKNISAEKADDFIAGYMVMNDLSARALQMEEMQLSLGPAKGKDFATSFGPCLVTPDELMPYKTDTPTGHEGCVFSLRMEAWLAEKKISSGNSAEMNWTFAELIERCSYGVELFPGDIIGSGTVGTGCLLELNGTGKRENSSYQERWLQDKDTVRLEVEGLGVLENTLRINIEERSIFRKD